MTIPQAEMLLPEYIQFAKHAAHQRLAGGLQDAQAFATDVHAFFTPAMMAKVENVIPGWQAMSTHADQQTLIHVTSVLIALYLLPEFQSASPEQQRQMEWIVLAHASIPDVP